MKRSGTKRCDGVDRREFLRVGAIPALGLSLTGVLTASDSTAGLSKKARNCILVWLDGGPSHMDTFDLKPDAPAEVRGELKPIPTNVDGMQVSEHFEKLAKIGDKICVIRSMTSDLGVHGLGSHYVLSGYKPSSVLQYPSFGSVVARCHQEPSVLPPYVAIRQSRLQAGGSLNNGYLPNSCAPFSVEGDPSRREFRVRDLNTRDGLTLESLGRRREFLNELDRLSQRIEHSAGQSQQDVQFEQAYRLILSKEAKQAFDLSTESRQSRDRYGKLYNRWSRVGQSCLLARRLVEAGCRFVTVTDNGWDMHGGIYQALERKLPALDSAVSALISDLADRGMLDDTLVLLMGEFGRTPRLNAAAGRDHWPRAFSVMLAGGGVRTGQVIGKSDPRGFRPVERPVTPTDLARTVYTLLGINPDRKFYTSDDRPVLVSPGGQTIDECLA